MPLLGKIVVIKRNGGDGTEFPLTASCMFGRKLDCDIRIQLPQVSKEHCKIELNENKELILTNLSSVNPTRINGEVFNQSERLKHGDLITIIDRSFRFEYPPPKTPKKKRLSEVEKDKTVQALQDQQEKNTPVPVEKRNSIDTCLKDGSNLPPSVEQIIEAEPEDGKLKKSSMSPFCELYQMVKQDLVTKSPWKPELPKTPLARPQVDREEVPAADVKSTPKQVTTPSTKKRRSSKSNSEDMDKPATPQSSFKSNVEEKPVDDIPSVGSSTPSLTEKSVTPVSQKKRTPSKLPQKFSAGEVVQQILLEPQPEEKTPKSLKGRRSGGSQDHSLGGPIPSGQTPGSSSKINEVKMSPRTSPRSNAGKRFQIQDGQHEVNTSSASKKKGDASHTEASVAKAKKKRVSFGGQLSPELFDKRLPPNSPLRRGATPRHSLGPSLKSQSLLRRASTIGLLALRLEETVPEAKNSSPRKSSPKRATSAAKTPSPAKRSPSTKAKTPSPAKRSPSTKAKTPSPAKRSPSTKAKTPSPIRQKSPSASNKASTPATPKTPASARRASTSAIEAAGDTLPETPRVQGRFSVSRISTPSPVQDQEQKSEIESAIEEDTTQKCVTPKIPLRRKSMKSSAKKTPKSAIKSALHVMRSRRSGASRANLKVLSSWADIVKFGQAKPQTEVTTKKKPAKSSVVKRTVVPKPKTPARRLKDDISTGHAASPLSIVVGRAHMRTNQTLGAAPIILPNIVLSKKDMKMDEDFTGVADIFKTPANSKSKNTIIVNNECPEVILDEMSVMKTPEESGEMIVSPLSVVSTAKRGWYSNDAVTRLLLDNQDGSLLEDESPAQLTENSNEASGHDIIPDQIDQAEEEESAPEIVETPKQKAAPSSCLTGVKRLMKTPKQRSEPIEDLRGKLLKTPKERKPPQEESLEGVKELLKTPKYRGTPVEDMAGVKRVTQTPKEKSNPILCAAGLRRLMKTPKEKSEECEDLTGVQELMKTPQMKGDLVEEQCGVKEIKKTPKRKRNEVEEDLTGIQQLMKTPKHRGEPVDDQMGVKRLMQTPKEKFEPVEDLTGVKQLMQTPKQKGEPVTNKFGISKLMKTPRVKGVMAEEDFTGLKELVEPENNSTSENILTEPVEIQEPVLAEETGSTSTAAEDLEECDKENVCPVETMETEVLQSEDLPCIAQAVESNHSDPETETVVLQENHPDQIDEQSVTVEAINDSSSEKDEKSVSTSDNTNTAEATPASSTVEQEEEELIKPSLSKKIQRGSRGRAAQKCKNGDNEMADAPSVLTLTEEEHMSDPLASGPARGRRGKKLLEVPEVVASPVRKSARGRIPKRVVDEEPKKTVASQVLVDSGKMELSDCLPVVTKTRKGRKAKQDNADAAVEPIHDVNASDSQCSDVSSNEEVVQTPVVKSGRRRQPLKDAVEPIPDVNAEESERPDAPENGEKVQAPVVKSGKRKKMEKTESQPSEELEQETAVSEDNAVAAEVAELQTSQDTESVSSTRTRRGRPSKKEHMKTEQTQILESNITSTPAVVVVEQPLASLAKSGRGRKDKGETVKDQPSDDVIIDVQTAPEVNVHNKEPEMPVVKSGRGRKARQQKPQTPEEVIEQPTVDTETVPATEEHTETVVKPVRGSRNTKQSKVTVEAEQKIVIPVEQTETPVAKSSRKRANVAKETKTELEVSVRRGRRAVVDPATPVAVVSSLGRKAVVNSESEVTKDVASVEPVKPVRNGRRTAKVPESKKSPVTQADSEVVATETTAAMAPEKVERGSRGKRQKDSAKDIPSSPVKVSAATEEASEVKPSKSVNWNPNLVASKDIEESTVDVEPPQKKPRRLGKLAAVTSSTESSQSTDLQPRGRRGRAAAKKEEELPVENSQEETPAKVKPLRRGKSLASSASKPEPSDSKASTPLKRKRNEVLADSDESINTKPLPKRRGRVANGDETAEEVSSKAKIPKAAPEKAEATPKKSGRAGRGQKTAAQEPDPVPTQEPVSGTATRKGRGVKKVEEVEAAPVRRTRRK